jgi:polysaccharide pyruvyl transferase WcaK-like protein
MNILVENNCTDLLNMGDVAMLQTAVQRLSSRWPHAAINVVTSNPDLLERYCPCTQPVPERGRSDWFNSRNLFGRVHDIVRPTVDAALTGIAETVRRHNPRLLHSVLVLKSMARSRSSGPMDAYIDALLGADLVVVSGGGDINDTFADYALTLFEILDVAEKHGIPTVLLGQGIGPLSIPALRARAISVLPYVTMIGIREGLMSPGLLRSLNVPSDTFSVTGDDAIEMAHAHRGVEPGSAIGVNIRVSDYSMVDSDAIAECASVLERLSSELKTNMVAVPISFYPDESDMRAVAQLVGEGSSISSTLVELPAPEDIMDAVSKCRMVITGSYHSAVFALAQGIPAIGVARTQYYRSKFLGLMDQFGGICDVICLDDDGFPDMLLKAGRKAWENADIWRNDLLRAAQSQVKASIRLYDEMCYLVESRMLAEVGIG